MKHYADDQLLLELQSGNHLAFREIYERYADKLIAFALKKTQCEDEAMDMVQELFLTVWKNRDTIQVTGSLEAYLMVSVNYMAYRWYKKQSKQPQSLSDFVETYDAIINKTTIINENKHKNPKPCTNLIGNNISFDLIIFTAGQIANNCIAFS